jgi:hypothetical protein
MVTLRLATHDSGPGWFATPFLYDSLIHNSTPVYPGALNSLLVLLCYKRGTRWFYSELSTRSNGESRSKNRKRLENRPFIDSGCSPVGFCNTVVLGCSADDIEKLKRDRVLHAPASRK